MIYNEAWLLSAIKKIERIPIYTQNFKNNNKKTVLPIKVENHKFHSEMSPVLSPVITNTVSSILSIYHILLTLTVNNVIIQIDKDREVKNCTLDLKMNNGRHFWQTQDPF